MKTDFVTYSELTEVSDVPHGVDGGVTLVENDEQWRSRDTFCQCLSVQIFPEGMVHLKCCFN